MGELVIIAVCIMMLGSVFISKMDTNPSWQNVVLNKASNRNVQFAVDAFVAKKNFQPVTNKKVSSCVIPEKLDIDALSEELNKEINADYIYFLDYYGSVWAEDPDKLLTVTRQGEFLVFNNTKAKHYNIWEIKNGNCSSSEIIDKVTYNDGDTLYYKMENPSNKYLIQPIYDNYESVPVGSGFDGRIYK